MPSVSAPIACATPVSSRARVGAGGALDELGDLLRAQACEMDAHDALRSVQVGERVRKLAWHVSLRVAKRREQQHPRVGP